MRQYIERHFRIALEHLAEGTTYEQLGVKYGVTKQRIAQIVIEVYEYVGCTANPSASAVGLAVQRHIESQAGNRYIATGTPEWFRNRLKLEREEDRQGPWA